MLKILSITPTQGAPKYQFTTLQLITAMTKAVMILLVLINSACSTNGDIYNNKTMSLENIDSLLAEKNLAQGEAIREIYVNKINDWKFLDEYHVLLKRTGKSKGYLVRFFNRCFGLNGSSAISYQTRTGRLSKADAIKVIDSSSGSSTTIRNACLIEEIYRLQPVSQRKAKIGEIS